MWSKFTYSTYLVFECVLAHLLSIAIQNQPIGQNVEGYHSIEEHSGDNMTRPLPTLLGYQTSSIRLLLIIGTSLNFEEKFEVS